MARTQNDAQPHSAPAGRRARQAAARQRRVEFSLTEQEYQELSAAAARSGLARGAYAADAALSAARGLAAPADAVLREALGELIRSAGLVRRIGVNLNQAVAKLNATGQRSGDLLPYAEESARRAERLDAAAEQIRRRLRGQRTNG
jgi:Mobilization protein NikA